MTASCLVLSDIHGRGALLHRVARVINFRPAAILFLGDGLRDLEVLEDIPALRDVPVHAVSGNCDGFFGVRAGEPATRCLTLFNVTIWMTHGHLYDVRSGCDTAVRNALAAGAQVLLYGHTHVATEYTCIDTDSEGRERRLLVANPGSLGEPRDGGGHRFGVLTLSEGRALFGHGTI